MADIERMRVTWSGSQVVGPSVSTFFFPISGVDPAAVLAFFDAVKSLIPNGVQITVPNAGDVINDATGDLNGSWAVAGGGNVQGTNANLFILGTGVRIVWETLGIRNNRHVRGSTFLVPVAANTFDTSGRITPANQTLVTNAATALIGATPLGLKIWSRPKGGVNGTSWDVTSARVPEVPSWLRSRRV
jgi:hypothetical protein